MPTKFITEFELHSFSLFAYHDEYFLRAVKQVLSDTALICLLQLQQEFPITTWNEFKQVFLKRFHTPDNIESLCTSSTSSLTRGDNQSTSHYFERFKLLVSEMEPTHSLNYFKRKFFEKLRNDTRSQMPIALSSSSSFSVLVQKAIEIDTNIIQQKINDKLRIAYSKKKSEVYNRSDSIRYP